MAWWFRALCARRWQASPLPAFGDGEQSRCFCHVGDTVRRAGRAHGHAGADGG